MKKHKEGNPLGRLMLCLVAIKLARSMKSICNTWYLDDGTIGRIVDHLIRDLETVSWASKLVSISTSTGEIIIDDNEVAAHGMVPW